MITDPRRMLNGYTFTPEPLPTCYVGGCYAAATVSALHRRFGRVSSCASHHPERAALALTFGHDRPVVPTTPAAAPPIIGGTRVPRRPKTPKLPPQPDALPLPGTSRPF